MARSSDRKEILDRLLSVRPDSAARFGRMSARQMVCHVADAYRMALGEQTASVAGNVASRTLIKWVALFTPLPWPPGVPTRPELDQAAGGGTAPVEFDADVSVLATLVDRLAQAPDSLDGRRHPYFGALSKAAWLRWGYLHADHHLRQFGA